MLSNVTSRLLVSISEKEKASAIVNKKYREEGYVRDEQDTISKIASYIVEENSVIFGAFVGNEIFGTLAFVFDEERGLPMEAIYKEEVNILRGKGFKVGEVVQFAVDQDIAKKHLSSVEVQLAAVPLFGRLLSYAKKKNFDYLCISVNPKHVSFYSLIGFEKIGELKHYASVDAPAVAMSFSLKEIDNTDFGKNAVTKMIKYFFSLYEGLD